MSGGLVALLDDIATLAKAAAASIDDVGLAAGKASAKAAGVVVDDTAVTPQYVRGVAAKRELPIIRQIAMGSLRNKLLIILPVALLLSQFVPWLLTPILMLGGTFLCFEGAEKIWEKLSPHHAEETHVAAELGPEQEKTMVKSAITTDLILSAEIMVISLREVTHEPFVRRLMILLVVAVVITAVVYGVVALIVKMDDIGLRMVEQGSSGSKRLGELLVKGMPKLLAVISVVGTAAMLWVGGHLLLVGAHELGQTFGGAFGNALAAPYTLVHHWEEAAHQVAGAGGFLAWLVNTAASAVIGLIVGAIVVAVLHVLPFGKGHRKHGPGHAEPERHDDAEVAPAANADADADATPAAGEHAPVADGHAPARRVRLVAARVGGPLVPGMDLNSDGIGTPERGTASTRGTRAD